jgi:ABC-type uncharacterized transport system permease subunit
MIKLIIGIIIGTLIGIVISYIKSLLKVDKILDTILMAVSFFIIAIVLMFGRMQINNNQYQYQNVEQVVNTTANAIAENNTILYNGTNSTNYSVIATNNLSNSSISTNWQIQSNNTEIKIGFIDILFHKHK